MNANLMTKKIEMSNKAKLLYPDDVIEQFKGYMDKIQEMY